MGVVGILVSLTLPAVQAVRAAACRTSCQNNLKQIGLAIADYHATYGRLPPMPARRSDQVNPNASLSWMALLLPNLDQEGLYRISAQACAMDADPTHNPPHAGFSTVLPIVVCRADGWESARTDRFGLSAAFTSYIGVGGAVEAGTSRTHAGAFGRLPGVKITDINDGTSETVIVGERPPPESLQAGWWYPSYPGTGNDFGGPNNSMLFGDIVMWIEDKECAPARRGFFGPGRRENPCDRYHFWSLHSGGGNWLFADGSVRFLNYSANEILPALATIAGGETVKVLD